MWQLKKIATGVGLIILLELLATILKSKYSGASFYYFLSNLLACYQILILLFCIITLFVEELMFKRLFKNRYKILGVVFFFVFVLICELVCGYLLYHPKSIPKGLHLCQDYYREYEMNVIQFNKQISEYNERLFYKLKDQHKFLYDNIEFSNLYHTNSKGFRDDEASLQKPSIIFLGDSYTMGWGVEQEETFGSVLENITGLKGLNAGMSSYGTARESMVLSSLDTSNLDFIIWQYCYNDAKENKTYIDSNFVLPIRSQKEYNHLIKLFKWNTSYFPGKFFLTILNLLRKRTGNKPRDIPEGKSRFTSDTQDEAQRFIDILAKSKINWDRTRVIVMELNYKERPPLFIKKLQDLVNENMAKKEFMKNLTIVDLKSILRKEDYYVLDIHLTKEGNFKVGEYLAKTIRQLQNK